MTTMKRFQAADAGRNSGHDLILTGAPQVPVEGEKGRWRAVRPLDKESLQNHDRADLFANYISRRRSPIQNYTNMIAEGASVPTIGDRACLSPIMAGEFRAYKKVAKFSRRVFRQDQSIPTPRRGIPRALR